MRRCCCKRRRECIIHEDDFNRPPSDDLGPRWDEVSGDWRIQNNALECTSAGGVLKSSVRHPSPDESMCVSLGVDTSEFDGVVRLLVNYKDSNNYLWGRFDFSTLKISIGSTIGGVDSTIREVSAPQLGDDDAAGLTVTFSRTHLLASASSSHEGAFDCASHIAEGYYSGIMYEGGTRNLVADGWSYRHHNRTWLKYNPQGMCCESICQCVEGVDGDGFLNFYCVPRNLTITFEATDDLEPTLDGAQIDLTNDSDIVGQAPQIWKGRETICQEDWCFTLECAGYDITDWALYSCGVDNYCVQGAHGPGPHPTSVSCNPLILEFGPFTIVSATGGMPGDHCRCMPDPGYGTYKMIITETAP
jgi:hypothetical protein